MRHVAVMTATGAVGLMAIFVVDLLSLLYVSRLGDQSLKAAVGYASQVLFLAVAVNIGLTIAVAATVSRALGAGDRPAARRLAASGLAISGLVATAMALGLVFFRGQILEHGLHAQGRAGEIAYRFLAITLPANVPLALGMGLAAVLRATGDARRAMYVTLAGGAVTALTDPLLIFGFGLGVYGAAWATVISRLVFLGVGAYGAIGVHDLVGRPGWRALRRDLRPILSIGLPAVLTNLATPAAAIYITRVISDFGEAGVAAVATTDRLIPVAFGAIFALTASIGPILGQNLGAKLIYRVRRALTDSFLLSVGYVLVAWAVLFVASPAINWAFDAHGDNARLVTFFLQLRRLGLAVHGLPVRRQHCVQQSRLSAAGDPFQLGPRDVGNHSFRGRRRQSRRSRTRRRGRNAGRGRRRRRIRSRRGLRRLPGDGAARHAS